MLDDPDAQVQREALRAIMQVGTTEAYQMLEQALKSGAAHTRDAIMQALGALPRRKGRAAVPPHPREHRLQGRRTKGIYTQTIESLGKVGARRALGGDA